MAGVAGIFFRSNVVFEIIVDCGYPTPVFGAPHALLAMKGTSSCD
jgi:hypothetical protein